MLKGSCYKEVHIVKDFFSFPDFYTSMKGFLTTIKKPLIDV